MEDETLIAAFARDGCSINNVACRQLVEFYPVAEDVTCLSHTIDHVGSKFHHPTLTRFWHYWIQIFTHRKRARKIFATIVGLGWKSYSATRWWSKFECFQQLKWIWGDVLQIITEIKNAGISESAYAVAAGNMLADARTVQELKIELAAVCDAAEVFIKATYILEGDGLLAFSAFDRMPRQHLSSFACMTMV